MRLVVSREGLNGRSSSGSSTLPGRRVGTRVRAQQGMGLAVADRDLVLVQAHKHATADQRRPRRIAAARRSNCSGSLATTVPAKRLTLL